MIYEECVQKLICELCMKGKQSVNLFMGRMSWHDVSTIGKSHYHRVFSRNGIPYRIYEVSYRENVLILGEDRLLIAKGLLLYSEAGKFNAIIRNQMIKRLSEGRFPDPDSESEIALEIDLLMNPPANVREARQCSYNVS